MRTGETVDRTEALDCATKELELMGAKNAELQHENQADGGIKGREVKEHECYEFLYPYCSVKAHQQ